MEHTPADRHDSGTDAASTVDEANDPVFDAVADAHRRFVVSYLDERGPPVEVETLATALAGWDDELDDREARIRLHHTHLPKLERADVVTYDDAVAFDANADVARSLLACE